MGIDEPVGEVPALGQFFGMKYSAAVDLLDTEYQGPDDWESKRQWLNERLGLGIRSAAEIAEIEANDRRERVARLYSDGGFKRHYDGLDAAGFLAAGGDVHALTRTQEYIDHVLAGGRSGAYFHGNLGRGKTWLVHLLGQSYIKTRLREARFENLALLLDQIRDEFGPGAKERTFATVLRAGLLILDDVGAESPTRWAVERLYEIINFRLSQERPVIFTSNFGLADLEARLIVGDQLNGLRIVDRIREHCEPWVIEVGGRNLRRASGSAA